MNAPTPLAAPRVHRMRFARPGPRAWLRVDAAATRATVVLNGRVMGGHLGAWTPFEIDLAAALRDDNELEIRCQDVRHWTEGFLPTLGVRWTGVRSASILTAPTCPRPPAAQRAATRGRQLLVDGRPLRVRGILHWGCYPELGCPWPDDEQMRREIIELQALGFNLIKFCLWIPPPRYYELCDELGMLVWQEYPVWNRPLARDGQTHGGPSAGEQADSMLREFSEFFQQDAPFGCIILRTLTCENDHVDPQLASEIIALARQMIPGCLVRDNSGWLCSEREGDFHDEHPYVHNAHWKYYARRLRGRLTQPLLLGETMVCDTLARPTAGPSPAGGAAGRGGGPEAGAPVGAIAATLDEYARSCRVALHVRRHQIETLAAELPDAGYVLCGLRDLKHTPLGLYTHEGKPKYTPQQWRWHNDHPARPRAIPDADPRRGPIIGPRKGQWKCPEHTWWSPIVRVLEEGLPRELIERQACGELLSGRVLSHCEGTRVLVELWDVHSGTLRKHPLVVEFETRGQRRVVSAFRHDTPAGRRLWDALQSRRGPAPEIGPLVGTAIVLENWEMSLDGQSWTFVKCDTPLVNQGRNMFEGRATFRTRIDYPGGRRVLRCECVGDWFEVLIDARRIGEAGPRDGTWDGTRDVPREFEIDAPPGEMEIVFHVRDWRAGGGMVGPVFFATDLSERIF